MLTREESNPFIDYEDVKSWSPHGTSEFNLGGGNKLVGGEKDDAEAHYFLTRPSKLQYQKEEAHKTVTANSCYQLMMQTFIVIGIGASWTASTQFIKAAENSDSVPGRTKITAAPVTVITWFVTCWNLFLLIPVGILSTVVHIDRHEMDDSAYSTLRGPEAPWRAADTLDSGGTSGKIRPLLRGKWRSGNNFTESRRPKEKLPLLFERSAGIQTTCACCKYAVIGEFEDFTWVWTARTWLRWMAIIFPFYLLWFATYVLYTTSLQSTSATVASTMFATSPLWVYLFSLLIIKSRIPRPITFLLSILLTLGGIAAVMEPWNVDHKKYEWKPILLSLGAACAVALYKVLSKHGLGNANILQVCWFLSALGLVNSIIGIGIVFASQKLHFEDEFSFSDLPWFTLCISGLFGILTNFLINFGIAVVHPVFISLGTAIGIPMNALVDVLINHIHFSKWKIVGFGLVFVGFLVSLGAQYSRRKK